MYAPVNRRRFEVLAPVVSVTAAARRRRRVVRSRRLIFANTRLFHVGNAGPGSVLEVPLFNSRT